MRFTVYRTTCTANGKIYIGVHETDNPKDDYIGSGKLISRALKKHGRAAFKKEVLHDFETRDEMYAKEAELVTEEFVARDDNYNLLPGGMGGWYVANQLLTEEQRQKISQAGVEARLQRLATDPVYAQACRLRGIENLREAHAAGKISYDTFTGRSHTAETRAKISASMKVVSSGSGNSQYGTAWICKVGEKTRKVKKTELDSWIAKGWQRGRKVTSPPGG